MKLLPVILVAVLFAGCTAPGSSLRSFAISGGRVVQLPVTARGALPSETKDVKIEVTGFMLDGQKAELTYGFGFTAKTKLALSKVVVEDVTAYQPVLMVSDDSPTLDSKGYWKGESSPRKAGDASLAWVFVGGDTTKIFQFTITTDDGRVLVIHQASIWPGQSKAYIRKALKM